VGRRPGALARYLLDHAEVDACDIDPFAIAAIRINAAANGVAWLPKANLVGRASAGTWRNA
jgi:predicted nicotinamide N-methyase